MPLDARATGYCDPNTEIDVEPDTLLGMECYIDVDQDEQTFTNRKGVEVTKVNNTIKEYTSA